MRLAMPPSGRRWRPPRLAAAAAAAAAMAAAAALWAAASGAPLGRASASGGHDGGGGGGGGGRVAAPAAAALPATAAAAGGGPPPPPKPALPRGFGGLCVRRPIGAPVWRCCSSRRMGGAASRVPVASWPLLSRVCIAETLMRLLLWTRWALTRWPSPQLRCRRTAQARLVGLLLAVVVAQTAGATAPPRLVANAPSNQVTPFNKCTPLRPIITGDNPQ